MGIQAVLGNNNEVEEDDLGAYVEGDFSYEVGGRTLRGNVGVRYVQTDQTSTGYAHGWPAAAGERRSQLLGTSCPR